MIGAMVPFRRWPGGGERNAPEVDEFALTNEIWSAAIWQRF